MGPVILISPSYGGTPEKPAFQLLCNYAGRVAAAGGTPVLACGGEPTSYAELCDALLLSGGCDLDPSLYGEVLVNDTVGIDPQRDSMELGLFRAFLAAKKPIFGICRGCQLINVALGGTLWQDIPTQRPETGAHSGGVMHGIKLTAGTRLSGLYGGLSGTVNSFHHQCIKDVGTGLIVSAMSEDGLIEGIESVDGRILAVQWHPERLSEERLFSYIIKRVEEWQHDKTS